jgi:hypothetical protein
MRDAIRIDERWHTLDQCGVGTADHEIRLNVTARFARSGCPEVRNDE